MEHYDIIIIGTGAGGGTLAHELASTGKKILILERGDYLPNEQENWDAEAVFVQGRYNIPEQWKDKDGNAFTPGTHYFVGGNTKFYGAALLRLREKDFDEIKHYGGTSPAWPLKYKDFQPYYLKAEKMYEVHGQRSEDPTEPPETEPYYYPPVSHEPRIQEINDSLKKEGLNPFHLPVGVRLNEENKEESLCVRCDTCDGYPCLVDAKSDAHRLCIEPIHNMPNITVLTKAKAMRLNTDASGKKITEVEVERDGQMEKYTADLFVVSCGAINSSALLLRSHSDQHPNGLANSSDQVGRNYMCHNNSAIVALSTKQNPTHFQKTMGVNDFYFGADDSELPLGHIQMLGKVKKDMLKADAPFFTPNLALEFMANHAVGYWITSEDLPDPNNRVLSDEKANITLHYTDNNMEAHERLLKKLKHILNCTGGHIHHFPSKAYLSKKIPIGGVAHQVGTCRFGTDPKTSVLDTNCKAHDCDNLYVVDGSFFCSSGAVNPGLTIIANAIRMGEHFKSEVL